MEKIIGIDVGGSGTGFVVTDSKGKIYFRGLWPLTRWDDPSLIARQVSEMARFDAVGIAAAGAWTDVERAKLAEVFKHCGNRIRVISDAEAALLGAFAGGPGVVVIAGTGSVALGRGRDNRFLRAGGFGHVFGDKGGGFWLARKAISAALEAIDGIRGETGLIGLLEEEPRDFVLGLMGGDLVKKTASLAPRVIALAEDGDETAMEIVGEGLRYLVGLASGLVQRLGDVPVSYHGGLFGSVFFLIRFKEMCALGGLEVREPAQSGAWGAAWAACGASGSSSQN
ncbi:MAG: N-acetylglucosamine kinase [candidate division WOR-3 bacterium]